MINISSLYNYIKNNNLMLRKYTAEENTEYIVESVENHNNQLYVFGRKNNIKAKYVFIFDNLFEYETDKNSNINVSLNKKPVFAFLKF